MSKVKTAEEFYNEQMVPPFYEKATVKELMRAYASHVLEVAAERAKTDDWFDQRTWESKSSVDKYSILDIKKEL